jgi:hypothetical protein
VPWNCLVAVRLPCGFCATETEQAPDFVSNVAVVPHKIPLINGLTQALTVFFFLIASVQPNDMCQVFKQKISCGATATGRDVSWHEHQRMWQLSVGRACMDA